MKLCTLSLLLSLAIYPAVYAMEFIRLDKNHSDQYFSTIFDKFLKAAQEINHTPENNNFLYSIKRFKTLMHVHRNCHNILEFFELVYPGITEELNARITFLNKQQDLVPLFHKIKHPGHNSRDQHFSHWRNRAKVYNNQYEKEHTSLIFNNNPTFFQIVEANKNYDNSRDETALLARICLVAMTNQLRDLS